MEKKTIKYVGGCLDGQTTEIQRCVFVAKAMEQGPIISVSTNPDTKPALVPIMYEHIYQQVGMGPDSDGCYTFLLYTIRAMADIDLQTGKIVAW